MSALDEVLSRIDNDLDASLGRLFELLRIPSVSTDPAHDADCRRAADWLAAQLALLGLEASARETGGHPMVVAHGGADAGPDAAHVLFYGHYDVQPPDPLDLWDSPPFEPHLGEGPHGKRIVGRGASDDKGQLMTFIEACRAWIAVSGGLPLRVTVVIEGEEESGSKSLGPFLDAHRDELSADVALVCDTGMYDLRTPAITTMLRGLLLDEVIVTGPSRDLHSGMYGGPARNPIHVLSNVLADLHGEDGRVRIPGFYDGVHELPAYISEQWRGLGFDEAAFLGEIGLSVPAGEQGFSVLEQIWARPTCDVNGIIGGYTGTGTKTVIPSIASAKVSFRLVGDQDPEKLRRAFRAFVRERIPEDCSVAFVAHGGSPALVLDTSSEQVQLAADALRDEFGRAPVMMGSGGSIPIVGSFRRVLGMNAIMIGFGLDDDRIHSPNEKYELSSYHQGTRAWARILDALSGRR